MGQAPIGVNFLVQVPSNTGIWGADHTIPGLTVLIPLGPTCLGYWDSQERQAGPAVVLGCPLITHTASLFRATSCPQHTSLHRSQTGDRRETAERQKRQKKGSVVGGLREELCQPSSQKNQTPEANPMSELNVPCTAFRPPGHTPSSWP